MARLLFLTGTPPDVRGGSGTFVGISVLRRALLARGHDVDLLAPAPGRSLSLAGRLLFNLRERDAVGRLRPEVAVGFDLDGLFLRRGGALRVASLKGVLADEARYERGAARARLVVEAFFERIHVRRVERVLATSAHSASRIVQDYGVAAARVFVVPEPIEIERWTEALRSAEDLPREKPSILCVAHLYPRKNVATLLAAIDRLERDAVLRVVGTGPELPRLQNIARHLRLGSRVEFLGYLPFARLAAEYRRADVFCLPSRQEGFGIVFLEAMAAGIPIVAGRAAAVAELLGNGEYGVLVTPGDGTALAGALDRLLGDPAERQRLADAGRRRVQRYDAPRVAEEFLDAIGLTRTPSKEQLPPRA
jgi:glycosyltransferase involved in cell wall biosynthesis